MKSKMLLCDRAVGQVLRQGAVLGQGVATGVEIGGCPDQDTGVVLKTRAVLGLSCDFMTWAWRVRTWRHRCPRGPLGIGNMF